MEQAPDRFANLQRLAQFRQRGIEVALIPGQLLPQIVMLGGRFEFLHSVCHGDDVLFFQLLVPFQENVG